MGGVPLLSRSGIEMPRANYVGGLRLLLVRCLWALPPPAFVSLSAAVADGTAIPFPHFHERHVSGLHPLLLFPCACWLADVRIVEVGHEPFGCQDVGRILLLPEQVVVVQLRRDGLEPFLVRQEEEEARKVLLTAALHCLLLETIIQRQFLCGAHRCKQVGGDKHKWELPGNYPIFTVVMVIFHYVERI